MLRANRDFLWSTGCPWIIAWSAVTNYTNRSDKEHSPPDVWLFAYNNFLFVELLAGALLGKAIVLKKGKNQSSKSSARLLSSRKEIINQSIIQLNHQLFFYLLEIKVEFNRSIKTSERLLSQRKEKNQQSNIKSNLTTNQWIESYGRQLSSRKVNI